MAVAIPVISEEDYPAFRHDVGTDLADTYDEWFKVHREQIEKARSNGDTLVLIEVKHDELIAFCRSTGTTPDHKALLNFTIKKASGE